MSTTKQAGPTVLTPERAANLAENPFAGQGPVLLDIGDDIGAIVLQLPASMEGAEIEITRVDVEHGTDHAHTHPHVHPHGHGDGQDHHEGHAHDHGTGHHHPHVAVVARPTGRGVRYSAVFPDLVAGTYELNEHAGDVRLRVEVAGGSVTEATWQGVA